jgi:hypothetical protein
MAIEGEEREPWGENYQNVLAATVILSAARARGRA